MTEKSVLQRAKLQFVSKFPLINFGGEYIIAPNFRSIKIIQHIYPASGQILRDKNI